MGDFSCGDIIRFTTVPLHYAVYIGDGDIVHYNKRKIGKGSVCIIRENLKEYLRRSVIPTINVTAVTYIFSGSRYSPLDIRQRALSCVGNTNYNPLIRNCEHFATWCVYGKAESDNSTAAMMGTTTGVGGGAGALIGGTIGSIIVPVAGTIAGAIVGGIIGTGAGVVASVVGLGIKKVVHAVKDEEKDFK